MRDQGFTLVELAVSLGLLGIATVAIGSVFVGGIRSYSRQVELAQVRATLRMAMATFTRELRVLDARDSSGSDITEMRNTSLTYRAARNTYFLCTVPDVSTSTVTVWQQPYFGLRRIEPERDSLLLFAENEVATADDDVWLPASLASVTAGGFCPGGAPGLRLVVHGLSQGELGGLTSGAAVRGFQMTAILLYSDSEGRSWAGLREWRPGSGWSITQPILGPLARDGLRFAYHDTGGGIASTPADVARIVVTVIAEGYRPTAARATVVRDSLAIHVGLRNNPRRP